MVFETIRALLAEQLGYDESAIRLPSSFEDLELGETDLQELMLLLEQEFELVWTEEDLQKLETIAELTSFIENQI